MTSSKKLAAYVIKPSVILTESQKICLRHVARGLTSKEIALETGLSPQTVDTYLKSAMARLGAENRRDAARRMLESEVSQQLGSPSGAIAPNSAFGEPMRAASERGGRHFLAPPPLGGSLNELTGLERTLAVLKVAALSAAALVALTLLIAGVLQTLR